jgi:hypothetical protein
LLLYPNPRKNRKLKMWHMLKFPFEIGPRSKNPLTQAKYMLYRHIQMAKYQISTNIMEALTFGVKKN